ncbi:MAG: hypothetical protein R6U57_10535 [Anaerolineales bacterium]
MDITTGIIPTIADLITNTARDTTITAEEIAAVGEGDTTGRATSDGDNHPGRRN